MTLGTHVAFASVLYLGGVALFGYRPDAVSWALAAVASLLPDVDPPTSKIGRLCWFVAMPLERRFCTTPAPRNSSRGWTSSPSGAR